MYSFFLSLSLFVFLSISDILVDSMMIQAEIVVAMPRIPGTIDPSSYLLLCALTSCSALRYLPYLYIVLSI
jgi:hypothetical protein